LKKAEDKVTEEEVKAHETELFGDIKHDEVLNLIEKVLKGDVTVEDAIKETTRIQDDFKKSQAQSQEPKAKNFCLIISLCVSGALVLLLSIYMFFTCRAQEDVDPESDSDMEDLEAAKPKAKEVKEVKSSSKSSSTSKAVKASGKEVAAQSEEETQK
jgi:hypothetical protein